MKCPVDHTPLLANDRSGIEVATCPECGGVWLAPGNLEKLLDATTSMTLHPDHFKQGKTRYGLHASYDGEPGESGQSPFRARQAYFRPVMNT